MLSNQTRIAIDLDVEAISTLILAGSADGTGVQGSLDELNEWRLRNAAVSLIRRRISDERTLLLVSEVASGHESVGLLGTGYATISTDVDAYIGGVACSVRGQGVGFSIVNGLVNWLGQKNITLIEMTIAVHNREMQGLATKIGFTKESEFTEDRFYKTGYFGNWFLRL